MPGRHTDRGHVTADVSKMACNFHSTHMNAWNIMGSLAFFYDLKMFTYFRTCALKHDFPEIRMFMADVE